MEIKEKFNRKLNSIINASWRSCVTKVKLIRIAIKVQSTLKQRSHYSDIIFCVARARGRLNKNAIITNDVCDVLSEGKNIRSSFIECPRVRFSWSLSPARQLFFSSPFSFLNIETSIHELWSGFNSLAGKFEESHTSSFCWLDAFLFLFWTYSTLFNLCHFTRS